MRLLLFSVLFLSACIRKEDILVKRGPGFTIRYARVVAADAEDISALMLETQHCLREYFGPQLYQRTFAKIPFEILLYHRPGKEVDEGGAYTWAGTDDGKLGTYRATLHILALSRYRPGGKTLIGENYDRISFHKLLAHEYAQIFLDVITRQKARGWLSKDSPAWFKQGYPEWLGNHCLGENLKTQRLAFYRAKALESTDNPYLLGAVRMEWLHQKFGKERLFQLLQNPSDDFWQALGATLWLNRAKVEDSWR